MEYFNEIATQTLVLPALPDKAVGDPVGLDQLDSDIGQLLRS